MLCVVHLVRWSYLIQPVSLCLSWDTLGGRRAPAQPSYNLSLSQCQCVTQLYSWYFISHRTGWREDQADSHNPPGPPQWKHSWYHSSVCSVILSVKKRHHHTTSHHVTPHSFTPSLPSLISWPSLCWAAWGREGWEERRDASPLPHSGNEICKLSRHNRLWTTAAPSSNGFLPSFYSYKLFEDGKTNGARK